MSSKRGRKRNDNLPPNRARDVQRAFRARRAAHLQALEQRVAELEEENACLRQALNLPPANRLPLGKGPTGKDKPKSLATSASEPLRSRESSSADSPASIRRDSTSPSDIAAANSRAVQNMDDGTWEQTIIMNDQASDVPSSSASSSYPLPPMSAPAPSSKPMHYSPYPSSVPSSSRSSSLSSPMYMNSQPTYSHSADRPMGNNYGSPSFAPMRGDIRDEQRQQYSYSPSPYHSHDTPLQHSQSNPSAIPTSLHNTHHPQRDSPLPYVHRRSVTEPQAPYTINSGFPHLPNPHSHQNIRLPSPPRLQDSNGHHTHLSTRHIYSSDGRINSMT